MPANQPLPLPSSYPNLIVWASENGPQIDEMVRFYNLLRSLQVEIVPATDTRGLQSLVPSDNNVVLPIPLQFDAPITDATVALGSVVAQLNLLLFALRKTGQLPS